MKIDKNQIVEMTDYSRFGKDAHKVAFAMDMIEAYNNKRSRKPRIRVQSGQDLSGNQDLTNWVEIR